MDERICEWTPSPSVAWAPIGPIAICETTTLGGVTKPNSTPRCDEHPARDAPHATIDETISKPWYPWGSHYPPH
jgi:hypothetical protein